MRRLIARIRALFASHTRLDDELDAEMRAHLDALEDEHRARGLSDDDARAAARRDFGGVAQIAEAYRDQRGVPFFDTLAQDLRYALRMWGRAPAFSVVVIAVLALGIGANTAMFTLVDALLFRPLPGHAAALQGVYSRDRTRPDTYRSFSYPNYTDLRDRRDIFDGLIAHAAALVGMPAGDTTRRAFVEVVSSNFFSTLGVPLAAGRTFTAEEERPGAQVPVAIVRYEYWKNAGFDPAVLGRTIRINAQDFTIVGVAPPGFTGTTALFSAEVWLPLGVFDTVVNDISKNKGTGLSDRSNHALLVAGLLKAGVSADAANVRLDTVSKQMEDAYPGENHDQVLSVHTLSRVGLSTGPQSDTPIAIAGAALMPLSGAVLFIACLNIANMFLARGSARRKEIAIRLALGGSRRRIVRQLLTEGALLAIAGAMGGLVIGAWTIRAFVSSLTSVVPLSLQIDFRPDTNILLATTFFTVASTLAFGLAPAMKVSRPDVVTDLKDLGGDAAPARRFGTRSWLVVGQIAVSLVLIAIGGSVAIGAIRAANADPGFRYDGELLISLDASMAGYDEARGQAVLRAVLDRVRAIPGVAAAGTASIVPFGDSHEGRPVERPGVTSNLRRSPTYTLIGTDYFKALGLPLLRGREFTEAEVASPDGRQVAIVDDALVRALFPGEDPIGKQIRLSGEDSSASAPMQIVGVVPDVQDDLIQRTASAHLYVPSGREYRANTFIHVRTEAGRETTLIDVLRREIRGVDSRLPILELTPMRSFHDRGLVLWLIRAAGGLLSAFGILALSLAAIGVYGVKSYVVAQRTREIGIRVALGARPADVLWLVLRDGARMTAVGLAIGLPIAVGIDLALGSATNGVLTVDVAALVLAPMVLGTAAACATYIPARRATRITPLEALRAQT